MKVKEAMYGHCLLVPSGKGSFELFAGDDSYAHIGIEPQTICVYQHEWDDEDRFIDLLDALDLLVDEYAVSGFCFVENRINSEEALIMWRRFRCDGKVYRLVAYEEENN